MYSRMLPEKFAMNYCKTRRGCGGGNTRVCGVLQNHFIFCSKPERHELTCLDANDYTLIVYIGVQMVSGMVKMILQITYLMDLEQKVVLLCAGPGPK